MITISYAHALINKKQYRLVAISMHRFNILDHLCLVAHCNVKKIKTADKLFYIHTSHTSPSPANIGGWSCVYSKAQLLILLRHSCMFKCRFWSEFIAFTGVKIQIHKLWVLLRLKLFGVWVVSHQRNDFVNCSCREYYMDIIKITMVMISTVDYCTFNCKCVVFRAVLECNV